MVLKMVFVSFEYCELKCGVWFLVFFDGNLVVKLMIIGEVSGWDEDCEGCFFVGCVG